MKSILPLFSISWISLSTNGGTDCWLVTRSLNSPPNSSVWENKRCYESLRVSEKNCSQRKIDDTGARWVEPNKAMLWPDFGLLNIAATGHLHRLNGPIIELENKGHYIAAHRYEISLRVLLTWEEKFRISTVTIEQHNAQLKHATRHVYSNKMLPYLAFGLVASFSAGGFWLWVALLVTSEFAFCEGKAQCFAQVSGNSLAKGF